MPSFTPAFSIASSMEASTLLVPKRLMCTGLPTRFTLGSIANSPWYTSRPSSAGIFVGISRPTLFNIVFCSFL